MTRVPRSSMGLHLARWLAGTQLTPEDEREIVRLGRIQARAERKKYRVLLRAILRRQMESPQTN